MKAKYKFKIPTIAVAILQLLYAIVLILLFVGSFLVAVAGTIGKEVIDDDTDTTTATRPVIVVNASNGSDISSADEEFEYKQLGSLIFPKGFLNLVVWLLWLITVVIGVMAVLEVAAINHLFRALFQSGFDAKEKLRRLRYWSSYTVIMTAVVAVILISEREWLSLLVIFCFRIICLAIGWKFTDEIVKNASKPTPSVTLASVSSEKTHSISTLDTTLSNEDA